MEPVLLGPGEGEVVANTATRQSWIKLASEELTLTEFRYAAGERGPAPHVHRQHSDGFVVLEGELTVELGGEPHRLGPGGFSLAPPGVAHTFRNEGPETGRFLNLHAPSLGFHDYLRMLYSGASREQREASYERFDQWPPPEDGGRPASDAIALAAGEGHRLEMGPSGTTIKLGGDDGDGALTVMDTTIAPGFPGPIPHRHRRMLDSFYVLEGTLTVQVGEDTVEAGPGAYAAVPPGTVHKFSNPSREPVRFLNLMAPGGFERYLVEVSEVAAASGEAPDPERMAEIAGKYDFEPAG